MTQLDAHKLIAAFLAKAEEANTRSKRESRLDERLNWLTRANAFLDAIDVVREQAGLPVTRRGQ